MSAAAGPHPASSPAVSAGRAVSVLAGSQLALLALCLLLAGGVLVWAHATQRDSAGYYTSPTERLATPTYALTAEGLELTDVRGVADDLGIDPGRVRIRATAARGAPVFVGIAREADLDRWLSGVAHDQITNAGDEPGPSPFTYDRDRSDGTRAPGRPAEQTFWAASATGAGAQTVRWDVDDGRWAVVVMSADGKPGVMADVSAGAKTGLLLPLGGGLLLTGLVLAGIAASLILLGTWHGRGGEAVLAAPVTSAATASAATADRPYPVSVAARLDEPLSRWLWLVKWVLAVPHWIVLAFLWSAFAVLTVVAWVAILVTGRYPRGIFDFNVGVLRWSWRVQAYAGGALSTDRYPPFTLAPAPDYPVELAIPYPERHSRVRAFFQPWLLAVPHLLIAGALTGAWNATWTIGGGTFAAPGLLTILVVVAGVTLLVTGRYPREVFRLLVGINRWTYRAIAYAALLRDEFPPFRLED